MSLAGHHGTNGGKRHPGAPSGRLTWTLSNVFGSAECHASATPCGRTFWRPQLGSSGSISLTLSLLSPREPCSPAAGEAEQGDVLGTIQSAMVLGDARETHLRGLPLLSFSSTKVSATSGLLVVGRFSFGRGPLMGGSAPWTPPWPPSGATHGNAAHGNVKSSARLLS